MSDGWLVGLVLGLWAVPFAAYSYEMYQRNKTKREILKTVQVLSALEDKRPLEAFAEACVEEFVEEFGE